MKTYKAAYLSYFRPDPDFEHPIWDAVADDQLSGDPLTPEEQADINACDHHGDTGGYGDLCSCFLGRM